MITKVLYGDQKQQTNAGVRTEGKRTGRRFYNEIENIRIDNLASVN